MLEDLATVDTKSTFPLKEGEYIIIESTTIRPNTLSAGKCNQADSGIIAQQFDEVTGGLRAALSISCAEVDLGTTPVSSESTYSSSEEDNTSEHDSTASSPHSSLSDETCIDSPDRASSLGLPEDSLEDLNIQKFAIEVDRTILPPCCNKIKEEWEHTIKIIESNQETEMANMKDDLEALQDLRQSFEMEVTHETQGHKDTLPKLREKSKEVRELKRELKAGQEALSAKDDLEGSQANATQFLEKDFASQKHELEKIHEKVVQDLNGKHRKEVNDLGHAYHVELEEVSKSADAMEDWKDKAVKLQAQHDDVCQGGISCTQQIDNLKCQLGKQERWLRQNWPIFQHEIQDATTNLAVAQQNLEKARNDNDIANLRISRLKVKSKITNEELKQAKKMLLADDAKAVAARILQECADQMAHLMTENHDRDAEIMGLYRKRDVILQGHQDQVNVCYTYISELEADRETIRMANTVLENNYMSLNGRCQNLQQENTDLQIMNNNLQIASNHLQISQSQLTRDNDGLRAEKESLELRYTWLEHEWSKLQKETKALKMQDAPLQYRMSSNNPDQTGSQESISKPGPEKATPRIKERSLQDQIDEAYPAQEEAFAAVRGQRKEWISTAQTSNKHTPLDFNMRKPTPITPTKTFSEESSSHNVSAHTQISPSPLLVNANTANTLNEHPCPPNATNESQTTTLPLPAKASKPQMLSSDAQQIKTITTTPATSPNTEVTSLTLRISMKEDTKTDKEKGTPKTSKTKKEKVTSATGLYKEKDTVGKTTKNSIMSKKERRALKKRS